MNFYECCDLTKKVYLVSDDMQQRSTATAAPRFFTAYRLLSKTGTRMAPYTSLPKKVIIVNSFHFKAISTITYIHRIDVTLVHVLKKVCKFIQHVCTNSSST